MSIYNKLVGATPEGLLPPAVLNGIGPAVTDSVRDALAHDFAALDESPPALGILTSGLANAAFGPSPIVFVGSSTTRGANATDPEYRYPSLVTRALQSANPNGGTESDPVDAWNSVTPISMPGVHGYNAGIGSTFSDDYLPSTVRSNIAAIQPRAVIHSIGGNDYAYDVPPADFKTNVESGINAIDSSVSAPVVHVLVHQQRIDGDFAYNWSDYADALHEIASAAPKTRFVADLSVFFEAAEMPGADPFSLGGADGVHLNDAGYRMLARLATRKLGGGNGGGNGGGVPNGDSLELSGTLTVGGRSFLNGDRVRMPNIPVTDGASAVHVDTTYGNLYRVSSSRRYKKDIEDWAPATEQVLGLRPREWSSNNQDGAPDVSEDSRHVGFIAEEVADLGLTRLVIYADDEDGNPRPESLSYDRFAAAHQVVLKDHEARIADLESENAELRSQLDALAARLDAAGI